MKLSRSFYSNNLALPLDRYARFLGICEILNLNVLFYSIRLTYQTISLVLLYQMTIR